MNLPGTSIEGCRDMLTGKMGGVPDVYMPFVDVRNVAEAHYIALSNDQINGERYALTLGNVHLRDLLQALHNEFKPQGYNVKVKVFGNFLIKMVGICSKQVK
jgi:dihydroflavonol-4-reductase